MDIGRRRRWRELSRSQKLGTIGLAAVQLALAATAWADLARRPATGVRGPKWEWALVIGVNFIGPLSYFRWGRLDSVSADH